MKYLVDSDYVADYLGAHPHAIQLLSSFAKDDLSISLITYGEIYEGIHFGRDPQKTTDVFQRFLESVKSGMVDFAHSTKKRSSSSSRRAQLLMP
jgi:predicted nucleic acid-binding protein